jgi:Ax21 family sulfation-dependent quorum factor
MKRSWFALVLLAALPFAASAKDSLSYTYVEAGYVRSDSAGDADGWGVNGSWAFNPNFHVFGSYAQHNADDFESLDTTQWTLGAGYRHGLNDNVDLVGRLAWTMFDSDLNVYGSRMSTDSNGASIEGGVRAAMGQYFEGYALGGYGDVAHGNGEFYTRFGGQAKINDKFGVAADVKFISGDTQWFVGPRFSW